MEKGQLTKTFDKEVGDHLSWNIDQSPSHEEALELKLFHYGKAEGGAESELGYIARNSENSENLSAHRTEEKKRKKFQDLMLKARRELDDLLALVNQRLEEIRIERDKIQADVITLETEIEHIQTETERFNKTCDFKLNNDGDLADPVLEKVLQDWEKKNGKKVDRDNFGLINEILIYELLLKKQELEDLNLRDKKLEQEETSLGENKNELNEAKRQLYSDEPQDQIKALEKLSTLEPHIKSKLLGTDHSNITPEAPPPVTATAVSFDNKFSF